MLRIPFKIASIAEQLALDATLLEMAEDRSGPAALVRTWELPEPTVIVGRSSRLAEEVDLAACRRQGVALARRDSGGCAVLCGPGCLMYSVLLGYRDDPQLRALDRAHAYVLERLIAELGGEVGGIARRGTSDLAIGDRKFSGNSMRCRRDHLLYHGTVLYDFPLERVAKCLRMPARQPAYRRERAHGAFLVNLPMAREAIVKALERAWQTEGEFGDWPVERIAALSQEQFGNEAWVHRR